MKISDRLVPRSFLLEPRLVLDLSLYPWDLIQDEVEYRELFEDPETGTFFYHPDRPIQ